MNGTVLPNITSKSLSFANYEIITNMITPLETLLQLKGEIL
jgi:hypothetical protein